MTTSEIAAEKGCTIKTVIKKLQEAGILRDKPSLDIDDQTVNPTYARDIWRNGDDFEWNASETVGRQITAIARR